MPKQAPPANIYDPPRGETITLPGNVTRSDFVQLMELAAAMIQTPGYQPQHREATALLLRGLMMST